VWDIAAGPAARELVDGGWRFRMLPFGRESPTRQFLCVLCVLCVISSADGPSTSDPSSGSTLAAMLGEIEN